MSAPWLNKERQQAWAPELRRGRLSKYRKWCGVVVTATYSRDPLSEDICFSTYEAQAQRDLVDVVSTPKRK